MKIRFLLPAFLFTPLLVLGQNKIRDIITQEYEKGHFSGALLYADGSHLLKINKGLANIQFGVEINDKTRFPIASVTKLFTTITVIQLYEKGLIAFSDTISKYIPGLPENCRKITIKELITHHSGLANEPIKAVVDKYSIDEYIKNFVKKSAKDTVKFNYNNVDFVLLSKIIESVTQKTFAKSIQELILGPLNMENTGFVNEEEVIRNLAYGYHNYSFGKGEKSKPLYNDRRYISNYSGAGAIYSTTEDLYKLLTALKANKLISERAMKQFVLSPQTDEYVDWLSGKPTFGFYFDSKQKEPVLRRSGSIDGSNSEIIINSSLDKILIILCNTDTADLDSLANKIYFAE